MNVYNITQNELEKQIISAINELYRNDYYLIEHHVHEADIVSHIGYYFKRKYELLYDDLNIDCEYNRNGDNPKNILIDDNLVDSRPDFIIHKRGCNDFNFAIIEFKMHWNTENRITDHKKLKAFTDHHCNDDINELYVYGFKYGLSIELYETKIKLVWFRDGKSQLPREYSFDERTQLLKYFFH